MAKRVGLSVVVAVAVLVAFQLTMPVSLSYATSGSMAPTIQEGSAYLVVHTESVETGDIITFYSARQEEYVTHRVVDRTDEGYITKGDANTETDQSIGIPPVPPSSVVGVVFSVAGHPLTVPGAGPILANVQTYSLLIVAFIGIVLGYDSLTGDRRNSLRSRDILRVGDIVSVLLITSFVACLLVIGMGGSSHVLTQVVTMEGTAADHTIERGESATRTISVDTRTLPLTTLYVDVDGADVIDRTEGESSLHLTVRIPPRDTIGLHRVHLRTYPYPRTLPYGVVDALHDVHWTVALLGTLTPVFLPLTLAYLLFFDGKTPIRRLPSSPGGLAGWR